jgi:hypothetical protein
MAEHKPRISPLWWLKATSCTKPSEDGKKVLVTFVKLLLHRAAEIQNRNGNINGHKEQ